MSVFNTIDAGEDDQDNFRFTASVGNAYHISITEETGINVRFYLFYVNGSHGLENISGWHGAQAEFTCARTGTYVVRVERSGGLTEGDYRIAVSSTATTYEMGVHPRTVFLHPGDDPYGLHASSSNSSGAVWSSSDGTVASVDGSGNVTVLAVGEVTIRATSVESPADIDSAKVFVAPVGDHEPNDGFSQATPITVGTAYQVHSISSAGDKDYLQYPVVQGYGYTVKIEDETGVDVRFYMYDHLQNAMSGWHGTECGYVCPANGVNYIRVERSGGTETGNYTIRVIPAYWNGESALVWDGQHEPTPNSYCSYPLATDGVAHLNTIDAGEDNRDYFRFTASVGNTYRVSLSAERGVNVRFYLYYADESHGLESISGWHDAQTTFASTHTGTYVVRVERSGGLTEGDYRIGVLMDPASSVEDDLANEVPSTYALTQNYPNPFNPVTTVRFAMPEDSHIDLCIYGVDGRLVRVLVNERLTAGWHTVMWNGKSDAGRQLPSGVYLLRLEAAGFLEMKRMTLVK